MNTLPVVIISIQTVHERNIAFSCNHRLIEFIKSIVPNLKKWNYGEAHHFKWSQDGIGGSVEWKVYANVSKQNVVIQDASHFVMYTSDTSKVNVMYLARSEILCPNVDDSIYVYGTLKIHHMKRVSISTVEFYLKLPIQKDR